jgi:hypothetical protein
LNSDRVASPPWFIFRDLLFEHDVFGKPVPTPLSKCGVGFLRITLATGFTKSAQRLDRPFNLSIFQLTRQDGAEMVRPAFSACPAR